VRGRRRRRRKAIAEGAARPAAATQSLGFLKHEDHEVDTKSTKKKEEESQRTQREDAESAEKKANRNERVVLAARTHTEGAQRTQRMGT
jgi:hypothetical protein